MTTIVTAIIAFTIVILLLVMILLFAQSKLVQSGDVRIIINGDESGALVTAAGTTLLSTLSSEKVFLPSACGGGGTCAMCKCIIEEGGGEVLPTEVGHLSRSEQKEHVRLATPRLNKSKQLRINVRGYLPRTSKLYLIIPRLKAPKKIPPSN
jgi:Na+-transporting NADH:ubiquinone oxidoreductase subunit F